MLEVICRSKEGCAEYSCSFDICVG
jgi:hypothetical protein